MVRHGMKVGDTFEDGGLWFEVLAVNTNGTYVSTRITKPIEKAVKEVETPAKVSTNRRKKSQK